MEEVRVVFDRIPAVTAQVLAESHALADRVRHELLQEALSYVPVDTGALHDSGHIDGEYVVFDAQNEDGEYYGAFVEEGTRYQSPQPFLAPAADNVAPMLPAGFVIIVGTL
jgi:hypothetical protein